jgi:hypothetical protein
MQKKALLHTAFFLFMTAFTVAFCAPSGILAKTPSPSAVATQSSLLISTDSATLTATPDAALATPSAEIIEKIQQNKDQDITETSGKQQDKLAAYLDQNPASPLSWNNVLEHAIRHAIRNGVPASTLVLVLLFPLIASIIAASRHVIGLRGGIGFDWFSCWDDYFSGHYYDCCFFQKNS